MSGIKKYGCILLAALLVILSIGCSDTAIEEGADVEETEDSNETETDVEQEETEVITIKCSHAFSPSMTFIRAWERWADEVTTATDGNIQFEFYHGAAMSKAGEELEHVSSGMVDMAAVSATWYPQFKLWEMNGAIPFQPSDTHDAAEAKWILYNEFPELKAEVEQSNQRVMFLLPYGDFNIISTKQVASIDDLNGLVMAVLGNWQSAWIEHVGAVPRFIPGPERFEALEKGVVDASLMGGISTVYGFRHHEVCDYLLDAGLGQYASFFVSINTDTWNKISPEHQKIMEELGNKVMFEWLPQMVEEEDAANKEEMANEWGITINSLPEEDRVSWAETLPNLAKQWVDEAESDSERELRKNLWHRYLEITEEQGYEWPMDWSNVD